MSIDGKRRLAAAGFLTLLALSVVWPSPVVSINRLCCNAALGVDELSFLGREAPSWDAVYWCLAGLFAIALLQSGEFAWSDFREPLAVARAMRLRVRGRDAVALAGAAVAVALIWLLADARVTAWAEGVNSESVEDAIRFVNRLGGGMNPALVVLFFLLAGVAYRHRRWVVIAVAMVYAGAGAGLVVQLVKFLVGRTRPELWLGPFHHARAAASSFPSGHTVGAFALAGVLLWFARAPLLRLAAVAAAIAVGLARVLAFRHWTSDVVASALAGLLIAAIVARGVTGVTSDAPGMPIESAAP
jgi:membrane-associated phospholipid phosphatase